MRTSVIIISIIFLSSLKGYSQDYAHAIGVRLGAGDGVGGEISYQQRTFTNNRLEFDLGFTDSKYYDGFKFTLMYQFVFPLAEGFNWYIGPGGSIGAWSLDTGWPGDDFHDDGFFLDVDGQIGLEYNFPIPLQISIDLRPEFGLINDDFDLNSALGLRYTF